MQSLIRNTFLGFGSVFFLFIWSGCTVSYDHVSINQNGYLEYQENTLPTEVQTGISELTDALSKLSDQVTEEDAHLLATHAYLYPMVLANDWELTAPPMYHNVLRNNKLRSGGLCTDWTQALLRHFHSLPLQSVDFYWAVAFQGRPLWEHSTVVVTPKGMSIDDGIILDPWRNSGQLYWVHIKDDPKFPWKLYLDPSGIRKRNLHRPLEEI